MINKKTLEVLAKKFKGRMFSPANEEDIISAEAAVGSLPNILKDFYKITNGFEFDSFRVLPVFDNKSIKSTWDSINRANSADDTKFSLNKELLNRFVIFAEIGALHCAFMDKNDETIWFEDDEDYNQTDLHLEEFITLALKDSYL